MLGADRATGEIKPVMEGAAVFRLMDTHGMPLGEIVETLRVERVGFDLEGFIIAARDSGNYTEYRVSMLLGQEAPEGLVHSLPFIVEKVWRR